MKNIENVVDKHLNKNEGDNLKNQKKETVISDEIIKKLEYKLNKLEEKVEYNDANLKANYILPLIVINYLLMAISFNFEQYLHINNYYSSIILSIVLALFFYKENKLISTKILKKIFLKG